MGFYCKACHKKVRGQPINHACKKRENKKYSKQEQSKIYANKHDVKVYNQDKSKGLDPPKPPCMQRRKKPRSDGKRHSDWKCPQCSAKCFGTKASCYKCNTPDPAHHSSAAGAGSGHGSTETHPWDVAAYHRNAFECKVCGCASEFDELCDRRCFCDSCSRGCKCNDAGAGSGHDSTETHPWDAAAYHRNAPECNVCGCASEFDELGDRRCFCDSCSGGCKLRPMDKAMLWWPTRAARSRS